MVGDTRADDAEARVRVAATELVEALVALARSGSGPAAVELLSVPDAAARIGIAPSTAWQAIAAGEVRSVKVRGRRFVPSSELDRIARGEAAPVTRVEPPLVIPRRRRRSA